MASITILNARLAFPNIVDTNAKTGKYGCVLLIEPMNPALAKVEKAVQEVAVEKFAKDAQLVINRTKQTDKYPIHDGETKSNYVGYSGMKFINTNSATPIVCYTGSRAVMSEKEIKEKMYAGAYVNAIIDVYPYSNEYGKGFGVGIRGLQFVKDGDHFSGSAPAAADDFPEIVDESEETPW